MLGLVSLALALFLFFLNLLEVCQGMFKRDEAQVLLVQGAYALEYNFDLVVDAHLILLFVFVISFLDFVDDFAWRQGEAGVTLEQVSLLLKILVRKVLHFLESVPEKFIEDAPEAPHVDGLVVLPFHEAHLWSSVPSGPYVHRSAPLEGLPLARVVLEPGCYKGFFGGSFLSKSAPKLPR